MKADTLRYLRCPLCRDPLDVVRSGAGRALRCPRRHTFDIARQGYVNLLTGRAPHTGDSAEMVAARDDFLATGHYDVISTALATAARVTAAGRAAAYPDLVVDVGAGTGRHLAAVLDALPVATGLALDVSKPALRRAARAHPRIDAALCDTWRPLPLADRSVAVLLDVFAPRNGAEFRRVLRPDGALLMVTPATDHLDELVRRLDLLRVDPDKAARIAESLAGHFDLIEVAEHRRILSLTRREVRALVDMGPSAWHTDPTRLDGRIAALPEPVRVSVAVRLASYRPA